MKRKILIIDDDPQLCQLLTDILESHGFTSHVANNTDEAFKKLYAVKPDLILLDVWLPTIGGLEFCRQLRNDDQTHHIPIIMLTIQDKEMDKVTGLEMGADDFITKPFSQRELLARIQALLRRSYRQSSHSTILQSGTLSVDLDKHIVKIAKKTVPMTPKEFELLTTLMKNRHKALSRQSLMATVWGYETPATTGTIDVHIRHLRSKIKSHKSKIKTVLGFGYRFDG